MSQKRDKLQLVVVDWVDSASTRGWRGKKETAVQDSGTTECSTGGFLLARDKKCVRIAQNKHNTYLSDGYEDHVGDIMAIPTQCVRRIRKLPIWR